MNDSCCIIEQLQLPKHTFYNSKRDPPCFTMDNEAQPFQSLGATMKNAMYFNPKREISSLTSCLMSLHIINLTIITIYEENEAHSHLFTIHLSDMNKQEIEKVKHTKL